MITTQLITPSKMQDVLAVFSKANTQLIDKKMSVQFPNAITDCYGSQCD